MFAALRTVAVIGVLTYLSPLRDAQDGPFLHELAGALRPPAGPAQPRPDAAAAWWTLLPEPARQAFAKGFFQSAAAQPPAQGSAQESGEGLLRTGAAALPAARDTLQPEDLRPPWRAPLPAAR